MDRINQWDWDVGKRELANLSEWEEKFSRTFDPVASHDGEKIAAVVPTEEMEFGVCENGNTWESGFDKVWHLRYGPDGRLTGLISDTGMWTIATDGVVWEDTYEFAWSPLVSADGTVSPLAPSRGGDMPWPSMALHGNRPSAKWRTRPRVPAEKIVRQPFKPFPLTRGTFLPFKKDAIPWRWTVRPGKRILSMCINRYLTGWKTCCRHRANQSL